MFFKLSVRNLILRFYLMMAIVIFAGFIGHLWLALLALPVLLSGMLGWTSKIEKTSENKDAQLKVANPIPLKKAS